MVRTGEGVWPASDTTTTCGAATGSARALWRRSAATRNDKHYGRGHDREQERPSEPNTYHVTGVRL